MYDASTLLPLSLGALHGSISGEPLAADAASAGLSAAFVGPADPFQPGAHGRLARSRSGGAAGAAMAHAAAAPGAAAGEFEEEGPLGDLLLKVDAMLLSVERALD